jgi:signal transduction histidine kinase
LAKPQPRKPLQKLLAEIVQVFLDEHDVPIRFASSVEIPVFLSPEQSEQVPRVVQESLVNALRHAQARKIVVSLKKRGDTIDITVTDDGCGFAPEATPTDQGNHFGLSVVQARATRIEGAVNVHSTPGNGTRVEFTFPMNSSPNE